MDRLRAAFLLLNTHAIGLAGATIATSALIRLGFLLSDTKILLSLYDRIALQRDPYNAWSQVLCALIAFFVGMALCYVGAPVTVKFSTTPPDTPPPGSVVDIKRAA